MPTESTKKPPDRKYPGYPKKTPCLGYVCGGKMRVSKSPGDRFCDRCKNARTYNDDPFAPNRSTDRIRTWEWGGGG